MTTPRIPAGHGGLWLLGVVVHGASSPGSGVALASLNIQQRRAPHPWQAGGTEEETYNSTAGRAPVRAVHHPEAAVPEAFPEPQVPLADQALEGEVGVPPGGGGELPAGGLFVFWTSAPSEHLQGNKKAIKSLSSSIFKKGLLFFPQEGNSQNPLAS